ncbi:hypothetical protein KIPB_014693, partial [Kipferlia bialata]
LAQTTTYLLANPETMFIATNSDRTFPTDGIPMPGTGTVIASVGSAVTQQCHVVGKPKGMILTSAMKAHGLSDPQQCCMVGDRMVC